MSWIMGQLTFTLKGRSLRQILCGLIAAIWFSLGFSNPALAEPSASSNILQQPATEIEIHLGNSANELKYFPDQIELTAGKRYKLVFDNPSPQKHYFTAKDFADASWTQKVEAGKVEIKGAIRELELKPGAKAEWVLLPLKPGNYTFRCPIAGHTEAGMTGTIKVIGG